ncbi:penicillin-binding transpeptidase domain-containing protein [soil metagenome]
MAADRSTWWWIGGALAAVVVVLLAGFVLVVQPRQREEARDDAAREAADAVAAAWQDGDLASAPFADPAGAQTAYDEIVAGLGGVDPETAAVNAVERDGDEGRATIEVTWPFGEGWTYTTALALTDDGDDWTATFAPTLVHPDLGAGDRLAAERTRGERGEVLGRDGAAIVSAQAVVEVGVQPSRATEVDALAATLAEVLDVDGAALAERIRVAAPEVFVPVITLRRADYEAVRDRVQPLPGTVFRESTLSLSPDREFARALLGTVGPVTAELIEGSDGRLAAGDIAGRSGLQARYDAHLAGTAGVRVTRIPAEGEPVELFAVAPTDGADLAVTVDPAVQQAADDALAASTAGNGSNALVAVDTTTGEILAVANTPITGANRALTGRYAPGSTFKAVSTLALLGTGLTPEESVPCPATANAAGREFRNFGGFALGAVAFAEDFAQSCNTAFVGLSARLEPGDLREAGASVGLGGDWTIGTSAFTGDVPVEDSAVELAAATIGQGRVLASPVAMAQVAATIARGAWLAPQLVTQPAPEPGADEVPTPDAARLDTVRDLMRSVVTDGSASALADVGGEPVHAKTGTAEYGTEVPPRTHAWLIGFQGDIAFAVLVEDGISGSDAGVPIAETFLRALR